MTKTVDYDIVGSYNNQRVSTIDAERSINLFEYRDPLGKKPKSLIATSGIRDSQLSFGAVTGGFRAQFVFQNNQYIVIGNSVFRISANLAITFLGTLNTASGYVGIDANTYQVIFVDGVNGFIYDTQNSINPFVQITDVSFPTAPIDICYLDGFFVVAAGGTNNFQLSEFNQGLVWGPDTRTFTADSSVGNNWLTLASTANYQTGVSFRVSSTMTLPAPLVNTATYYAIRIDNTHIRVAASLANAQAGVAITLTTNGTGTLTITNQGQLQQGSIVSHPGTIAGCRTLHRRLFLFSQNFTEMWENAGIGTNLPFRRNNSVLMEYGLAAIGSVAVGFDVMIFLSQDKDGLGSVMEVRGTESIPISTRALDFALARYALLKQIADCRGFLIKENGLIFYRMNFTQADHTYVYNITLSNPQSEETKFWHEEEMLNGSRHVSQTHAYFNGANYVGHYALPTLYEIDSDIVTNDGDPIHRTRITRAFVPPGYQRVRVDRLQVDLLQGSIVNLETIYDPLSLLTENNEEILSETGDPILLEDGLLVFNPSDLFMFISISKDGGQSYGNRIRAPMGKVGQRTYRTLWRKLGTIPRGQAFVAKFEFFGEVPFFILGASWALDILPE